MDNDRILFVCPLPPPYGGLANNTELILRSSLSRDFRIDVLDTSRKEVRIRLHHRGLPHVLHLCRLFFNLFNRLANRRYAAVYMKSTSDVSFLRETIFLYLSKAFGRRTVLHFHANQLRYFFSGKSRFCNFLFTLAILPADQVLFLSDDLMNGYERMMYFRRSEFSVLNNVVDTELYASHGETDGKGNQLNVLFVGRLTREKGLWDLLKIIPYVRHEFPNARFVFCGVGESKEDEAEIDAYIEVEKIRDITEFRGQVAGEEKLRAYREADVFVFPSYEEIFPNVLLEAMAAGLPVISTRIFCIPEIIQENENGFLIEPGDREALRAHLGNLLESGPLRSRLSENNVARAKSRYDIRVLTETLASAFSPRSRDVVEKPVRQRVR